MSNRFWFAGGDHGRWEVARMDRLRGPELEAVTYVDVVNGNHLDSPAGVRWALQGFTSNLRYAASTEVTALRAIHRLSTGRRRHAPR